MNANLVRTHGTLLDCWPVLAAYSAYLISFFIFAMTMSSVFLVA